jgi:NADP-dependent 3-hydroxy acid dehydrogenase YdfG
VVAEHPDDASGGAHRDEPSAGSVCLVTGASSGIGRAIARALAAPDVTIALLARRADQLRSVARDIEHAGAAAVPITADLGDPEPARDAVTQVMDMAGRLDVLVNNVGVMSLSPVERAAPADWDRMIDVNLAGMLAITRAALPSLLAAADGPRGVSDVVTISSLSAIFPSADRAVYSATKAAGRAFSEGLRREVAGRGVRVSVIEPGVVRTGLRDRLDPAVLQALRDTVDPPQALWPEDVAGLVRYLVGLPAGVNVSEAIIRPTSQLA